MSGKRMLVWLAFGVFFCAIVIAALLVQPRFSGTGSEQALPSSFSPVRTAPNS